MLSPARAFALALLSSSSLACSPGGENVPSPDGGSATDAGGEVSDDALFTVETRFLEEVQPLGNRGLAVALRDDGRWAVAYVTSGTGSFECQLFGGGEVEAGEFVDVTVAEPAGDAVTTRVVESVRGAATQAVDMAVTPAGELVLAYGGGEDANGYCGASDLAFARESGAGFQTQIVATDSATGTPCRLDAGGEDPYCQIGDTVGLYPGIAVSDEGEIAISYQDFHNGFADKDIYGADLEIARGDGSFALASISTEAGAGYHSNVAFGEGGRVITSHEILGSNVFPDGEGGSYTVGAGLYVAVEQTDGSYLEVQLVDRKETDYRVAVGWHASLGWVAAYHDKDADDLVFWVSSDDGATWTAEPVDQIGLTGRSPQLGFLGDGTPVLAYRYCGGPTDGTCNPAVDGVRVAVRQGSSVWKKQDLGGDDEELEGLEIDMAVGADDNIAIVSRNAARERAVLHLLSPR